MKDLRSRDFNGAPFRVPVGVPDPVSTFMPQLQPRHYALFWVILSGGFGGLILLTYETISLHSEGLEGIFVVAGSLFTPTLYVYYLDLRSQFVPPRWRTIVWTFMLGALLGVPIALVLEVTLLPKNIGAGASFPR